MPEKECVYSAVRAERINVFQVNLSIKRVLQTVTRFFSIKLMIAVEQCPKVRHKNFSMFFKKKLLHGKACHIFSGISHWFRH